MKYKYKILSGLLSIMFLVGNFNTTYADNNKIIKAYKTKTEEEKLIEKYEVLNEQYQKVENKLSIDEVVNDLPDKPSEFASHFSLTEKSKSVSKESGEVIIIYETLQGNTISLNYNKNYPDEYNISNFSAKNPTAEMPYAMNNKDVFSIAKNNIKNRQLEPTLDSESIQFIAGDFLYKIIYDNGLCSRVVFKKLDEKERFALIIKDIIYNKQKEQEPNKSAEITLNGKTISYPLTLNELRKIDESEEDMGEKQNIVIGGETFGIEKTEDNSGIQGISISPSANHFSLSNDSFSISRVDYEKALDRIRKETLVFENGGVVPHFYLDDNTLVFMTNGSINIYKRSKEDKDINVAEYKTRQLVEKIGNKKEGRKK